MAEDGHCKGGQEGCTTSKHEHADSSYAPHPQIEAAWAGLPRNEQERIFTELQELQKKDWKELSLDEKKAGGWMPFILYTCHV